jgi:hypothetical protein
LKDQTRDQIQKTAEKFADAARSTLPNPKEAKICIFYCYYDQEEYEWILGDAGNMSWIERYGAQRLLTRLLEDDLHNGETTSHDFE